MLESLCHWRWIVLALNQILLVLKREFQCKNNPALKSALKFAIGVETSADGVEAAPIGIETATVGVEIGAEGGDWH